MTTRRRAMTYRQKNDEFGHGHLQKFRTNTADQPMAVRALRIVSLEQISNQLPFGICQVGALWRDGLAPVSCRIAIPFGALGAHCDRTAYWLEPYDVQRT